MKITKKDAAWNFVATLLKIGSGLIVLPLIIRYVSREEYGIWTIFLSYSALINLVDFGFSNSFTRSVTYIFSGARKLDKEGLQEADFSPEVDYNLLKSGIAAMRFYYLRMAALYLVGVAVFGSWHLRVVLERAHLLEQTHIWFFWALFVAVSGYQLYTYYYDALMMGRGKVKQQKQIVVLTQGVNMLVMLAGITAGLGLGAMVLGLLVSVPLGRVLSRRCFYDASLKSALAGAVAKDNVQIIKTLSTNAIKLGFTLIGGFLVVRASVLIGAVYLPLSDIASFGLTRQLTDVIVSISSVWFQAFYPQITHDRTKGNLLAVKQRYIQSWWFFVGLFVLGSLLMVTCGNLALTWIDSKTLLLPMRMTALLLLMAFLENNHVMAANLLLMENRVPFFKASLMAGAVTVSLMVVLLEGFGGGVWAMLLAPFLAQAMYQNWKWPLMIIRQYGIRSKDFSEALVQALRQGFRKHQIHSNPQ